MLCDGDFYPLLLVAISAPCPPSPVGYGVPGFTAAAEASSACGQVRPVRGQGRSCAGVSMSDVSGAPNLDQQHGCAWKIAGRAVLGWIE